MKPKRTYSKSSGTYDDCYTPYEALNLLKPFLSPGNTLLDPACGNGQIPRWAEANGMICHYNDKFMGGDYMEKSPSDYGGDYDVQATNPPFSIKFWWLEKSIKDNKPFALFFPFESIGANDFTDIIQETYGGVRPADSIGYILPYGRINYNMPIRGDQGSAQMYTCIVTYGLGLGQERNLRKKFDRIPDIEWEQKNGFSRITQNAYLTESGWVSEPGDHVLRVEHYTVNKFDHIGRTTWYPNHPDRITKAHAQPDDVRLIKALFQKYGEPDLDRIEPVRHHVQLSML